MIKAGILGATGTVGQRLVQLLVAHPQFEIVDLIASERSAGGIYRDVCRWQISPDIPSSVAGMRVKGLDERTEASVLFSGLPTNVAAECEPVYAAAGHVVSSNASSYRMDPDVPLIIPEINPDHLAAIEYQQRRRGWRGMIVTNPNCTTIGSGSFAQATPGCLWCNPCGHGQYASYLRSGLSRCSVSRRY